MARKKKNFTKQQQEIFLVHLRSGMRPGAAAEAMDFDRDLVLDYIKDHEDFQGRVDRAEAEALEHVEEALFQAAISGNVAACKMWIDHKKGSSAMVTMADFGEPPDDSDMREILELAESE